MRTKPAALRPGDLVAIVAPSGAVDEQALRRGVTVLDALGLKIRIGKSVLNRFGYLAGDDRARASDLSEAWMDPEVKAVICARGGYGAMRILPYLDFAALKTQPKILLGFSDITALHVAFWREMRLITFHGPMVESGETSGLNDEYNLESLKRMLFARPVGVGGGSAGSGGSVGGPVRGSIGSVDDASVHQRVFSLPLELPACEKLITIEPGQAEGLMVGGNLSLVASTIGTRWELNTSGKILFLEEVGEKPYRIDRMLCQLALSGKLEDAAGFCLGEFTDCEAVANGAPSFTTDEVLKQYFVGTGKPCIAGVPAGHGRYRATIPFGVTAGIQAAEKDSETGSSEIALLESPTTRTPRSRG